jgi:hypothetical protein
MAAAAAAAAMQRKDVALSCSDASLAETKRVAEL